MKKYILPSMALLASAVVFTGCSENAWNDHLDGFESGFTVNKVTVDYTLTPQDYDAISKALTAIAETTEEKAAAAAIKSNQYFDQSSPYPAQIAVPYLLNQTSTDFYLYPTGSTANITLNQAEGTDPVVGQISSAHVLTITDPTSAEDLPGILKSEYPNAQEGEYAVVSYLTETASTPAPTSVKTVAKPELKKQFRTRADVELTSNIVSSLAKGDVVSATAIVTAQCSRGLILTDNAGSILYYNTNVDLSTYPIGTIVEISGTLTAYGRALEFDNKAEITVVGNTEFSYPAATPYTGVMVDEACAGSGDMLATFISLQGTFSVSVSNNYTNYNIIVDGATCQGSCYYLTDKQIESLEDGMPYTFYGYYVSISSGKFMNMVITSAVPVSSEVEGLTSNIKDLTKGDNLTATAIVTAQTTNGMVLTDNAGSIFYYYGNNFAYSDYPIGTIVNVAGEVSAYNNGFQLTNKATIEVAGAESYTYPTPIPYSSEMITEALTGTEDMTAIYCTVEGKVVFSGNYVNVIFAGTDVQGSVYYVTNELKEQLKDNKNYKLTGYFSSFKSPFFYIILTDAEEIIPEVSADKLTNAIFIYSEGEWVSPENATVLQPSDYAAMGAEINQLEDAAQYLPLYMKSNYPYALKGDIEYVAYNIEDYGCMAAMMIYDGSSWSMNNDGFRQMVASYVKGQNDDWTFLKYLGETIYTLYKEDEIELNKSYMFAYANVAAVAYDIDPTSTNPYGYIQVTPIEVDDEEVVMPNDENAFLFTNQYVLNGAEGETPEGTFLIQDINGYYLYLRGYNSFNYWNEPDYNGSGMDGFLWTAEKNSDGTWTITNYQYPNTIYYSSRYNNFAAYDSGSETSFLPTLFIMQ
ncbi:MAG: hypothetical protein J1F16_00045 [Muribaculaceae bacterium]|nr:hypothetical protein [Muribaculaceae bacterium]